MRFVECTYRTWEYIATETLFLCVLLACTLDSVALWRDGKMGKNKLTQKPTEAMKRLIRKLWLTKSLIIGSIEMSEHIIGGFFCILVVLVDFGCAFLFPECQAERGWPKDQELRRVDVSG